MKGIIEVLAKPSYARSNVSVNPHLISADSIALVQPNGSSSCYITLKTGHTNEEGHLVPDTFIVEEPLDVVKEKMSKALA